MASSVASSCSRTLHYNCPSVLVSNDLMQVIKDPEEEKGTSPTLYAATTMDDLLKHVKNYIVKNKLYDPSDPRKIVVHETALGSLLGKSEFSLLDVRTILLQKFVFPVETTNSSEVICSISDKMCATIKRKGDDFHDSEFSAKRIKEIEAYTSEESMHSFQNYETEFVKDSTPSIVSDDNFSVNSLFFAEAYDLDVDLNLEYEIETHSDMSDFSYDSDSDMDDLVKNAIITFIARSSDSDLEYLADGSSDESQSEQELSEEDKWRCSSCSTLNDPRIGCCGACWQTRSGWLSEKCESDRHMYDARERRQKALSRSKRKLSKKLNKNKKNKDSPNRKFSDLSSASSLSSPTSSNDSSDVYQSSSNTLKVDKESTKKNKLDEQLCLFCCERPADSSIIHGRVGCKICCFKCGKRLFDTNKRCPACRRTIERVVYLYNN